MASCCNLLALLLTKLPHAWQAVRNERMVKRVLETFGRVKHVHIGRDKQTNIMRAFGFATFLQSADADK